MHKKNRCIRGERFYAKLPIRVFRKWVECGHYGIEPVLRIHARAPVAPSRVIGHGAIKLGEPMAPI